MKMTASWHQQVARHPDQGSSLARRHCHHHNLRLWCHRWSQRHLLIKSPSCPGEAEPRGVCSPHLHPRSHLPGWTRRCKSQRASCLPSVTGRRAPKRGKGKGCYERHLRRRLHHHRFSSALASAVLQRVSALPLLLELPQPADHGHQELAQALARPLRSLGRPCASYSTPSQAEPLALWGHVVVALVEWHWAFLTLCVWPVLHTCDCRRVN